LVEGGKAAMGKVVVLAAEPFRRRMREQDVETALAASSLEARTHLDPERPPPHLRLGVLVGTGSVADRTAEPRDAKPGRFLEPTVNVDAALRPPRWSFDSQGRKRIVESRRDRVVVARYVQQRHVETADDVLEVVPGQVSARQDDVRLEIQELVSVQALVNLVRDGENARQASTSRR
jgi:hypothetical protein